jgi:hypothetical protein
LPRSTPSMSVTATFTRAAGDAFTRSIIFWSDDLLFFISLALATGTVRPGKTGYREPDR